MLAALAAIFLLLALAALFHVRHAYLLRLHTDCIVAFVLTMVFLSASGIVVSHLESVRTFSGFSAQWVCADVKQAGPSACRKTVESKLIDTTDFLDLGNYRPLWRRSP